MRLSRRWKSSSTSPRTVLALPQPHRQNNQPCLVISTVFLNEAQILKARLRPCLSVYNQEECRHFPVPPSCSILTEYLSIPLQRLNARGRSLLCVTPLMRLT